MPQKKILIADYTLHYLYSNLEEYPGGAAVEWYHWIKGFNENNVKVCVLSLKGTKNYIKRFLITFSLLFYYFDKQGKILLKKRQFSGQTIIKIIY